MNTTKDVAKLYNRLFEFESGRKKLLCYPIHKRMDFKNHYLHVYDFLAKHTEIKGKTILDAGCGVGFGSTFLANHGAKRVIGISISEQEIHHARNATTALRTENIEFQLGGFEQIKPNFYDLIVCVESLKHAIDLPQTLLAFEKALKPNGQLCVIDDFLQANEDHCTAQLAQDWNLNFLLSSTHFDVLDSTFSKEIISLRPFTPSKNLFIIWLKLQFFQIFRKTSLLKKLFHGGLLLDLLYAKQHMEYQLFILTKLPTQDEH